MRGAIGSRKSLVFALLVMVAAALAHLSWGSKPIALPEILRAFLDFDARNFDHVVVRQMRLPRLYASMSVGAALAVAGALMQGVTRNPLADPGLIGLMAGASFGVVFGAGWLGFDSETWLPLLATLGALSAAALVITISAAVPGGGGPAVLLLAGAAVSAFLSAVVSGLNLLNEESFAVFRIWLSGAITNGASQKMPMALPWLLSALVVSFVLARHVTVLSMGQEAAVGLGINTRRISLLLLICVVVLTASAVTIAGPLGFVGLVVPHATRLIVGSDYRRVIPFSAIFGAIFLLFVDVAARLVLAPVEIATGVVTSLLGAPLFVLLVRRLL